MHLLIPEKVCLKRYPLLLSILKNALFKRAFDAGMAICGELLPLMIARKIKAKTLDEMLSIESSKICFSVKTNSIMKKLILLPIELKKAILYINSINEIYENPEYKIYILKGMATEQSLPIDSLLYIPNRGMFLNYDTTKRMALETYRCIQNSKLEFINSSREVSRMGILRLRFYVDSGFDLNPKMGNYFFNIMMENTSKMEKLIESVLPIFEKKNALEENIDITKEDNNQKFRDWIIEHSTEIIDEKLADTRNSLEKERNLLKEKLNKVKEKEEILKQKENKFNDVIAEYWKKWNSLRSDGMEEYQNLIMLAESAKCRVIRFEDILDSSKDCPICFEKVSDTEYHTCRQCNIAIHTICWNEWIERNINSSCPVCRHIHSE